MFLSKTIDCSACPQQHCRHSQKKATQMPATSSYRVVRDGLVGGGVDDALVDRRPLERSRRTGGRSGTDVVTGADLSGRAVVGAGRTAAAGGEGAACLEPAVSRARRLARVEREGIAVRLVAAELLAVLGRGLGAVQQHRRSRQVMPRRVHVRSPVLREAQRQPKRKPKKNRETDIFMPQEPGGGGGGGGAASGSKSP